MGNVSLITRYAFPIQHPDSFTYCFYRHLIALSNLSHKHKHTHSDFIIVFRRHSNETANSLSHNVDFDFDFNDEHAFYDTDVFGWPTVPTTYLRIDGWMDGWME